MLEHTNFADRHEVIQARRSVAMLSPGAKLNAEDTQRLLLALPEGIDLHALGQGEVGTQMARQTALRLLGIIEAEPD